MSGETPNLTQRLHALSSGVISDVLDECGYPRQALHHTIRPLDPTKRLAGRAICFSGRSISNGEPAVTKPLTAYDMDIRMAPGSVAIIATHAGSGPVSAVVGGLMCFAFSRQGCAGIVCDGAVRDMGEIVELGLPTYSRYVTPVRSNGRWQLTDADGLVELPGEDGSVAIAPGDYVIGDADGVMVIPKAIAQDVVEWAEKLAVIEASIVDGIAAGRAREDVFKANPRFAHIRPLR